MTHKGELRNPTQLTKEQFKTISRIAYTESGLVLDTSKKSMISSRLDKRIRTLKLESLESYFRLLESSKASKELPHLLSALTTNVTRFFRESHHFETLRTQIIPELHSRAEKGKCIRIWSAGCSSGQELYSIAMVLNEGIPNLHRYDIRLLGTDINDDVITTAIRGNYSKTQLSGLPKTYLKTYFETNEGATEYRIKPDLKNQVTFKKLNLIERWPMKCRYDLIFCRNVVIYFDEVTRNQLWERTEKIMNPGAWMFLGHSERIEDPELYKLKACGVTSYRKLPLETSTDSCTI